MSRRGAGDARGTAHAGTRRVGGGGEALSSTRPGESRGEAPRPLPDDGHRTFIGIDPGLDGGIAVLAVGRAVIPWACPTPTLKGEGGRREFDRRQMVATLDAFTDRFAAIERVDAAPMHGRRQGTTSMWRFGQGYGLWLGIFEALGIPYVEVSPKVWKRAVLKGFVARDKAAAVEYVRRFHPGVELVQPRCRKPHDGVADAVCIAEYARRAWRERVLMGGKA